MESIHSPGRLQLGSSPLYRGESGGPETKSLAHGPKAWMGGAHGFVFWRGRHFRAPREGCQGPQRAPPSQPHPLGRAPRSVSRLSELLALCCCAVHLKPVSPTLAALYHPCVAARAAWATAAHCETADSTCCPCVQHLGEAILGLLFAYRFLVGCSTQMSQSPANSDHFMISFHTCVTLCYGHLCFSSKFI